MNFNNAGNKKICPRRSREHLLSKPGKFGIPGLVARNLIASGHYRSGTAGEAKQAVGKEAPGWAVQNPYLIEKAPLLLNGAESTPFMRLKPVSALASTKGGGRVLKCLFAKTSGCQSYFSPLLLQHGRNLKCNADFGNKEGEKQADSACSHWCATIGLSGVDCFRDSRCPRDEILPELSGMPLLTCVNGSEGIGDRCWLLHNLAEVVV